MEGVYQDALLNYLSSMARAVEGAVNKSLDALLGQKDLEAIRLAGEVFRLESRINEMETIIDDYAVRLLRGGSLPDEEVRLIVAALKITNDLERMGDLAVNIAERVTSLTNMLKFEAPSELEPIGATVRATVNKSLRALISRNVELAGEVLRSDVVVDSRRDQLSVRLLTDMTQDQTRVDPNMQLVLAIRYLERIADHSTNIAEDIIFWVRGLNVRRGRGCTLAADASRRVIENS